MYNMNGELVMHLDTLDGIFNQKSLRENGNPKLITFCIYLNKNYTADLGG